MTKRSINEKRSPYRRFSVREEAVSHLVSVRQVDPVLASLRPKL